MSLLINNPFGKNTAALSNDSITIGNTGISKTQTFSGQKSKKALNYNPKEISSQLLRAGKSRSASAVLSKAKSRVSNLKRCLGTGEYNDSEVRTALAHAKRMVKCAQTKVTHLKEEENLQHKQERQTSEKKRRQKNELKRRIHQKEQNLEQKFTTEQIVQSQKQKRNQQELLQKRKTHRREEQGKIAEADLKYLQGTKEYQNNPQNNAVSVNFSYLGMQMNELQQIETEFNQAAETDASLDTGETAQTPTVDTSGTSINITA